ncbi:MAG: tetratricopeptide repeat protein, partial [Planctomycetaceae bacterium]|nr:tetratricopeptide repeat protein [Planctomycetaceae bacterium]
MSDCLFARLNETTGNPVKTQVLQHKLRSAESCRQSGNLSGACRIYEDVLRRDPKSIQAWLLLGLTHYQLRDKQAAERSFRAAIRLQPANSLARTQLATVLLEMERPEEAEVQCRKALCNAPADARIERLLSIALRMRGQLTDALEVATRAAEKAPEDSSILTQLGHVQASLGRFDEAHTTLLKSRVLNPANPETHLRLCSVEGKLG